MAPHPRKWLSSKSPPWKPQILQPKRYPWNGAEVHHSPREVGAFMSPHILAVADAICRMKRKYIVHANQLSRTHKVAYETDLSQSAVCHALHEKQLCPFYVQLLQGLQWRAIMITSNSLVSSVQNCRWNWFFCTMYCGLMWQQLEGSPFNNLHSLHEQTLENLHGT
jgi:hypothetical protein